MKKRISVWSIFDDEFNLDFFPYTITELVYKSWCDGEFKNRVYFTNGQPKMSLVKKACETLIVNSGDEHHIYIENFRDRGNGVFELECGS